MENRSRRFPLTDQEIHQWMMMMTYQRLMNINSGYRLPENARGSGFGWAQEPAMATMMPSADMMNFCNHQPLGNNSGNGMYIPPPLQVIPPESTAIPLSVPAMPMPIESVPPLTGRRKKAPKRWSPEEHKLFLIGLKKFKRGDWKSISRSMVVTRSPTQVASHAQKYFNRRGARAQATATDDESRKKRSSIHDTRVEDVAIDPEEIRSLQDKINNQH